LAGKTLSAFIKENLCDELDVRASPHDAKTFGVVPKDGVAPDADPFKNFGETHGRVEVVHENSSLSNAARLAFTRVIPVGMARIVSVRPKFKFSDVDSALVPEGSLVIEAASVVGRLDGESDKLYEARVLSSIAEWAMRNNLAMEDVNRKVVARIPAKCLLDAFIEAMTSEQLSRVSLPLDVVAVLRRR